MHGVHINLVRATKKDLIWARLPPDHSHDYCDRWFSAVEGFVKDGSAKGVNSLSELVQLLKIKHTGSEYRGMRLQLSVLLCNHNFDAWLEGCLNGGDKVKGIKTPLVFRYHWDAVAQKVRIHFKHSVAAESTFERDEWGPWQNVWVEAMDQTSGCMQKVQVKRTVAEGVELEKCVPDFSNNPGFEAWIDDEDWSRERIFSDLSKWDFDRHGNKYKKAWNALGHWHSVNRLARAIEPGVTTITLGEEEVTLTNYKWEEMWRIIQSIGPDSEDPSTRRTATTAVVNAEPLQHCHNAAKTSRPDRGAINSSKSLHTLNTVLHPGYTKADSKRDRLLDNEEWLAHIRRNWTTAGQLWLIQLSHFEGEYKIGLGQRLFAEDEPEDAWEIVWYERINKCHLWGISPGFKLAIKGFNNKRQPERYHSTEPTDQLVPIVCELTPKCTPDYPRLSQACMQAVHEWACANDMWREQPMPKAARIANKQPKMLRLQAVAQQQPDAASSAQSDTADDSTEEGADSGGGTDKEELVLQHSPCDARRHLRRKSKLAVAAVAIVHANSADTAAKQVGGTRKTEKQRGRASALTQKQQGAVKSTERSRKQGGASSSATAGNTGPVGDVREKSGNQVRKPLKWEQNAKRRKQCRN